MNITMRLQLAVIFFTVLLTGLAQAQAPLAGTQIGNQASATYTDQSGVARQALSNTVITNVQQVAGLTLEQDITRLASPGGTVFFPHTLTNTGNGPDTYTLTPSLNTDSIVIGDLSILGIYLDADQDGQPDDVTTPLSTGVNAATTIELEPGEEYFFVIGATIPGTAADAESATIDIQADSVFDGTQTDTHTDTANVTSGGVMTLVKSIDVSQGIPGTTPITYTFTYTNTGNGPVANFTVRDAIPTGLTYVANSARASILNSGGTALTDADATDVQGSTPNGITYDYDVTVSETVTVVFEQVAAGQSGTFSFQVSVDAGIAPGTIINTATYDPNGGFNDPADTLDTNEVPFEVLAVPGVTLVAPAAITASPGETVVFTNELTNTGTGIDTFDLTFGTDTFPAGTTFQLFLPDGNTPMVDTDDDGIPDTGPLDPAEVFNVVVKATLPTNLGGATPDFDLPLIATGNVNDTAGNPATATDTDTVNNLLSARVDITNAADGADPDGGTGNDDLGSQDTAGDTYTADPGATITIPLAVENEGAIEDGYNLTVDSFPADWTIVIREAPSQGNAVISNSGSLDASTSPTATDPEGGGSFSYIAEVTVPAGTSFDSAAGGTDQDPYAITFRAESPTSGVADTIVNNVTVNPVRELSLTTDNAGQVFPGGSVVYTHLLKNLGNVDEGVASTSELQFAISNSLAAQGFTSVIYVDQTTGTQGVLDSGDPVINTGLTTALTQLTVGGEVRLFVKVFAPLGAPDSAIDVATLNVTPAASVTINGNAIGITPTILTNEDTTTVVLGDLEILKEQALDIAAADGNADGAYSVLPLSALPGQSIIYRVTVTNSGSTDATNILVYDTTPVSTTYTPINSTDSEATITGGTVNTVDTEPAVNTGGTFTFNVGTLQPGQSAVITFGVTIDQ